MPRFTLPRGLNKQATRNIILSVLIRKKGNDESTVMKRATVHLLFAVISLMQRHRLARRAPLTNYFCNYYTLRPSLIILKIMHFKALNTKVQ